MQSSVHGGLGTNLRFLLRHGDLRCCIRCGGDVKRERSAASDGRVVQLIQGGFSMFLHVVRQASEPGGFSSMNLALGVGSNIQVCSYSITAAENVAHPEVMRCLQP